MNNLLLLQKLDLKIEDYKAREKLIPRQKEKYAIRRERLKTELAESEARCKALSVEQHGCEVDIAQLQSDIAKKEGQLLAVKKNDEYQALLREIDSTKKQIAQKEERIIALMVETDDAKATFAEDQERIAAEERTLDAECVRIDEELTNAVKERETLQAQRAPLIKQVPGPLMSRYNRIRKRLTTGPAVVPLNDDTCSGCHMRVTAQVENEILAGDKMHSCSHCGRLLYHPTNFGSSDDSPAGN